MSDKTKKAIEKREAAKAKPPKAQKDAEQK